MAAGLGFKTFTTGEVLTADDVNGYLMQGVLVFASEAARNAAITSPQEGQFAFTKDNNSLWYYTGSAWEASGATGDIEGVTAGTGISGGGTSGTVTITNSMATEIDAKGDLIVGTGADTFARLAVGANNTVLTADSGEATGLKWAAPAGGGANFTLLNAGGTNLTGAASITISGISGYNQIFVMVEGASSDTASSVISVRINNLTTNQRSLGKTDIINAANNVNIVGDSRTTINLGAMSSNAGSVVNGVVNIFGCNTAGTKIYQYAGGASTNTGTAQENFVGGGRWDNTATVSSIVIVSSSGSFDAGTVRVYASA